MLWNGVNLFRQYNAQKIFPLFLELPRETEGAEKAQNTGVHILSPLRLDVTITHQQLC